MSAIGWAYLAGWAGVLGLVVSRNDRCNCARCDLVAAFLLLLWPVPAVVSLVAEIVDIASRGDRE